MDSKSLDELIERWYESSGFTINTLAHYKRPGDPHFQEHFGDCSSVLASSKYYRILIPTEWFKCDISPLIKMLIQMARESFVYTSYEGELTLSETEKDPFEKETVRNRNASLGYSSFYCITVENKNFFHERHQMMAHTIMRYLWSPKFSRILYHAFKMRVHHPEFSALECFVFAHYFTSKTKKPFEAYKGMMVALHSNYVVAPLTLGKIITQIRARKGIFNLAASADQNLYTTGLFSIRKKSTREVQEIIQGAVQNEDYKTLRKIVISLQDAEQSIQLA